MSIRVYNSLKKRKEEFREIDKGKVKIYVCGITPYNYPHIGNIRPPIIWDVIIRYLKHKGYKVKFISNFTDIDDKIIRAANNEKKNWKVMTKYYINSFFDIMSKLNVHRADYYPLASEHISEIIKMVKRLVEQGYAYEVEKNVYFSVKKFLKYGKLSGRHLSNLIARARIEVDSRKCNPMDFVLWKPAKPNEPSWDSPWGKGRPGWHIECSAMSIKYLGEHFDFHGGGCDLIFPHHENELAQSEAFSEKPFVNYWLHNEMITINLEKMSKSLGNSFLITDILQYYSGEVVRWYIASAHYRSAIDFNNTKLDEAKKTLKKITVAKENINFLKKYAQTEEIDTNKELIKKVILWRQKFYSSMDDDFNTPLAIVPLFAIVKEINNQFNKFNGGYLINKKDIELLEELFNNIVQIFGILEQNINEDVLNSEMTKFLLKIIIEIRENARLKKDWKTADYIRNLLNDKDIIIEDTPQGVNWKRK